MNDVQVQAHAARAEAVTSRSAEASAVAQASPFLPLLLLGIAFLGWTGFQTYQLAKAHRGLDRTRTSQEPQVEQSARLRASLSALASDTQRLADAGDPGAQVIVTQLRKRGITINPSAGPTLPAAP